MEKIVAVVHAGADEPAAALRERLLRSDTVAELSGLGVHGYEVHLVDHDVERAASLRIGDDADLPAAVVGLWVDTANDGRRRAIDTVLEGPGAQLHAYLVAESVPLTGPTPPLGQRSPGFTQVALIRRLDGLADGDWWQRWLGDHTPVAIETQRTTRYVQNAVVRALSPGAPPCDAVVEETFPVEAMDDPGVFFDAVGDPDRLAEHQIRMFDSVQRFIDLATIRVVPTSRYVLGSVGGTAE